jgi:MoxR-like ATPase
LAAPVLRHRLVPTFGAQAEGIQSDDLIKMALRDVPTPKAKAI